MSTALEKGKRVYAAFAPAEGGKNETEWNVANLRKLEKKRKRLDRTDILFVRSSSTKIGAGLADLQWISGKGQLGG